ncbi:MAG: hypothetical protein EOM51_10790 [Clostridia bacterium]|nr:hypothetical protein [Clostridia bacterium]
MNFDEALANEINKVAMRKYAGVLDQLGNLIGNNGSVSTPLMALGGAALGGMAGKGLGLGHLGTGIGATLGAGLSGIGANAINSQNISQENMDMALINGIGAGLNANDQTDMMQNQAIMQNNEVISRLTEAVGGLIQQQQQQQQGMYDQGMNPGMYDQGMYDQGMDPGMAPGMYDQGMDPGMPAGMYDQGVPAGMPQMPQPVIANNGLGKQASLESKLDYDIKRAYINKIASWSR